MSDSDKVEVVLSGVPPTTVAWTLTRQDVHGLGRELTDKSVITNNSADPEDTSVDFTFTVTRSVASEAAKRLEELIAGDSVTSDLNLDAHSLVSALYKKILH